VDLSGGVKDAREGSWDAIQPSGGAWEGLRWWNMLGLLFESLGMKMNQEDRVRQSKGP
jgi:hypothetical protein